MKAARASAMWVVAALVAGGCGDGSSGDGPDGGSIAIDADPSPPPAIDGAVIGADAGDDGDGDDAPTVLLFGGEGGGPPLGDTWTFDGQSWAGELVSQPRPDPRRDHALAYDPARERSVLFGGFDGSDHVADTWEWDGESWEPALESPGPMEGRSRHALAYDEAVGGVVVFGGEGENALFGDTWIWDGEEWSDASPECDISPRAGHAMVYDAASEELLLFGGDGGDGRLADTWVLSGGSWIDVSPASAQSPSARSDHALAYDPIRETVVLFGGAAPESLRDDTWEWDGATRSWSEIDVGGDVPAARSSHALVYDPATERVLLFGGAGEDDQLLGTTWLWDGAQWEELHGDDAGGPARSGHALAPAPIAESLR